MRDVELSMWPGKRVTPSNDAEYLDWQRQGLITHEYDDGADSSDEDKKETPDASTDTKYFGADNRSDAGSGLPGSEGSGEK